ncbi:MAG: RecQ family ATP-dependent DNA helicase, partial [Solirubrobacterales bacterium]|nr:RecQ family ATP-dependent DNA helicase [Solirubrobacterales bacterium]
ITTVPSERVGALLQDVAARVAAALGIAHLSLLERREARPPQREMANAVLQAANVRGAFGVGEPPPPGEGILLDDRRGSGWTLAMAGGQLRMAGAERIRPLVLATMF